MAEGNKIKAERAIKENKAKAVKEAESAVTPNKALKGVYTNIETIIQLIKEKENILTKQGKKEHASLDYLAKKLNWNIESIEKIGKILQKRGIVEVFYPATMIQSPQIILKKELEDEKEISFEGKVIDEYSFVVDYIPVNVKIIQSTEDRRPYYEMRTPIIGPYTKIFLEELKDNVAENIEVEASEIMDTKQSNLVKKRFFDYSKKELRLYMPEVEEASVNILAGMLLHSMYGLGKIELFMGDDTLEEIAINSSQVPISIYHRKFGWTKTNQWVKSEEQILNYAAQIGRKIGRDITTLNPILDAHLGTGDRVNATLNPISSLGNTMTIRKFARNPWTITDFVGTTHTMNLKMAALIWMAFQYELNVLVAGGTASGKTSTLNAFSAFIPSYHRIISIEDVREIMLPDYMQFNWVPMTTRIPNPEGIGEVTMLHLMETSLRMRPDRIIVGEIRRKKEAEVLFEAMHTGHSVYSTIHANSSREVLRRLLEQPFELAPLQIESIDLLLVQYRDRKSNKRRTYEISEIEAGVDEAQLTVNTIFKWDPREDTWDELNAPSKFMREIGLHTGMTEEDIKDDLKSRERILVWMMENKINRLNDVGKLMKLFYSRPEIIIEAAKNNTDPKKVLEV